jgi:hypothetical protein
MRICERVVSQLLAVFRPRVPTLRIDGGERSGAVARSMRRSYLVEVEAARVAKREGFGDK